MHGSQQTKSLVFAIEKFDPLQKTAYQLVSLFVFHIGVGTGLISSILEINFYRTRFSTKEIIKTVTVTYSSRKATLITHKPKKWLKHDSSHFWAYFCLHTKGKTQFTRKGESERKKNRKKWEKILQKAQNYKNCTKKMVTRLGGAKEISLSIEAIFTDQVQVFFCPGSKMYWI